MPDLPLPFCSTPGCRRRARDHSTSRCIEHDRGRYRAQDEHRPPAHLRGYDSTWQKLREAYISEHPRCEDCVAQGRILVWADEVHHVKPVRVFPHLRLVWDNLRALCKTCHRKATEVEMVKYPTH